MDTKMMNMTVEVENSTITFLEYIKRIFLSIFTFTTADLNDFTIGYTQPLILLFIISLVMGGILLIPWKKEPKRDKEASDFTYFIVSGISLVFFILNLTIWFVFSAAGSAILGKVHNSNQFAITAAGIIYILPLFLICCLYNFERYNVRCIYITWALMTIFLFQNITTYDTNIGTKIGYGIFSCIGSITVTLIYHGVLYNLNHILIALIFLFFSLLEMILRGLKKLHIQN